MSTQDIKSMTLEEIEKSFIEMGQPKYKAEQVFAWLHRGVANFDEMSNLSKDFRCFLAERFQICNINIQKRLESSRDNTVKYLCELNDGELIESVLMSYHHGYSICISTQAGCKMGCAFCATGKEGFSRNLSPAEMLSQITSAQRDLNIRVSNVVLMGMGEPLDNFDNVIRFLELVSSTTGLNIGMRHISLSTCGIVPQINRLADLKLQLTLSVSLHAPNDQIRSEMMPVNLRWGVNELLKSCRNYISKTHRRISFEYAMVNGVNDSMDNADELAAKLKGMLCHVNLIPVNTITDSIYSESSKVRIDKFSKRLQDKGINATIRRTLGADISASCGQLKQGKKRGG